MIVSRTLGTKLKVAYFSGIFLSVLEQTKLYYILYVHKLSIGTLFSWVHQSRFAVLSHKSRNVYFFYRFPNEYPLKQEEVKKYRSTLNVWISEMAIESHLICKTLFKERIKNSFCFRSMSRLAIPKQSVGDTTPGLYALLITLCAS